MIPTGRGTYPYLTVNQGPPSLPPSLPIVMDKVVVISQDDPVYSTCRLLRFSFEHVLAPYQGNLLLKCFFVTTSIMPQDYSFDSDSDWTLSEEPTEGKFSTHYSISDMYLSEDQAS